MRQFESFFGKWVVRHRWWLISATLVTVAGAALGMRYLTFNNDTRVFFSERNPQLQALETLENVYTKDQNIMFVLAPKDGKVFTRETLAAVAELTESSWQVPHSSRVDSLANFQHTRAEVDDLIVEDLVLQPHDLTDEDLERIEHIALNEPLLVNRLVSPTGHVTGVFVNIILPGKSPEEVPKVTFFARDLARAFRDKHPGIDLHLTGGVVMDQAFAEAGMKDMVTLLPAMLLLLLLITGLALRSLMGTLASCSIIFFSTLTAMGVAGWLRISITPAAAIAPTIILTLAVADSIHILVTMFRLMRLGTARHEAIAEALRINFQAILLTSLTTAIGFLTMNASDAPPFHDLGNIVAIGVIAAFIFSVLFLPALMAVIPIKVIPKPATTRIPFFDSLADWVIHHENPFFWGALIAIVVLTWGVARIELDDDFLEYFGKRFEIRKASDFAQEHLTGLDLIEYSLHSGEPGGINTPQYLTTLDEFAQWYRSQPKVVHVDTLSETMKRLNKNMHGDDESWFRIPERRDLAAQYLLLFEMSLPFGLDLNNRINIDKSATRMSVTVKNTSAREIRDLDTRARAWLKANAPEPMFTYGSGLSIIWAHISQRNINSMLGACFGALVLISAILIFALRSFRLGIVSLIPNLAPAFMAFGIWGMVVGRVGLGLSIIVSLTLGIVVDDTIHFLSKYLRARRERGLDPAAAVRYAFHTVGAALAVTTLALVAGFLVLAFSGYTMNANMGLMTAVTITLALLLDFFFLPVLLMKVDTGPGISAARTH